jgi:hypothetical protein
LFLNICQGMLVPSSVSMAWQAGQAKMINEIIDRE